MVFKITCVLLVLAVTCYGYPQGGGDSIQGDIYDTQEDFGHRNEDEFHFEPNGQGELGGGPREEGELQGGPNGPGRFHGRHHRRHRHHRHGRWHGGPHQRRHHRHGRFHEGPNDQDEFQSDEDEFYGRHNGQGGFHSDSNGEDGFYGAPIQLGIGGNTNDQDQFDGPDGQGIFHNGPYIQGGFDEGHSQDLFRGVQQ